MHVYVHLFISSVWHVYCIIRSKYNEFVLCMKKTNGEGSDACTDLRRAAKSLCLDEWVRSDCFHL